jgi:DMSO/TMAO reductase YedYZ molybdopterin-dependent catalytic subunit
MEVEVSSRGSRDMENDVIISPDTQRANRLPPNQVRTLKWPVLDAGGPPPFNSMKWEFAALGLVKKPIKWTWQEFQSLPRVKVKADFHCVTRWSRLDNLWEGVATREILNRVEVADTVRYVLVHAYDEGWSTNMPFDHFTAEDALFADTHDGQPLSLEHGGPLRLIVPRLYAWKSAKWIRGIEFLASDRAGYWEEGGYHMTGDPWKEERFG